MAKERKNARKAASDLEGHVDPRAPLDSQRLLAAARPVLALLAEDLLSRAKASKTVTAALEARHAAEQAARRTADPFAVWQTNLVDQVAAAWMLSCAFVRTLEDRGLIAQARLAGPGAADSQRLFFDLAPSLAERDYLLTVFRELSRFPAARDLFDAKHNPVWLLTPSAEAAKALLGLFRLPSTEAPAFRFGQADTRFLGDLYQDLNEAVQKRYALLQTPRFVESFILDRTLERAIERFGLDETSVIDPTCGSGHFLLGSFERLFDHRLRAAPGLDPREAARRALDAVYGADINPYAVAIARFRLTLAYLEKAGFSRLAEAPALPLHLVVADSLLHNAQQEQGSFKDLEGQSAKAWAGEEFALEDEGAAREVLHRRFAAVVGNPPYITPKDAVLRQRYRDAYVSAASQYSLGAPFTERFFQLARDGGRVGMITANSFMKREFGKRLVEDFLPSVNVDLIINTSGAYIPGHGTPTVLLFGTNEIPRGTDVLAVLAKRGEPTTPEMPEQGRVWRSIDDHWTEVGFENDYVTVAKVERTSLAKHPWSLGGGGAAELKERLEERAEVRLGSVIAAVGRTTVAGEDDVWIAEPGTWARKGLGANVVQLVIGECVRDWSIDNSAEILYPYVELGGDPVPPDHGLLRQLWPWRATLESRSVFGKQIKASGRRWWEHLEHYSERLRTPLGITFAFVATHNNFVLDHGGKVFNRSAPVIKLPEAATEDDHFALLAYLNSSTACFWMKQIFHGKGGGTDTGGWQDDPAKGRYEFAGTGLLELPLPAFREEVRRQLAAAARSLLDLAMLRNALVEDLFMEPAPGSLRGRIEVATKEDARIRDMMIGAQEYVDWRVYEAFNLIEASPFSRFGEALALGARPYEILLAGGGTGLGIDGQTLATVPPLNWREPCEAAMRIIEQSSELKLIESPEFKRRWCVTPKDLGGAALTFRDRVRERGTTWCQDSIERTLASASGGQTFSLRALVESLQHGGSLPELLEVLSVSEGALDLARQLVLRQAVPYLAALRFSASGLGKHQIWKDVWRLQRCEDADEAVRIEAPPKYDAKDFLIQHYFDNRGKLDVPKERFISYPGCESDQDGEPVYGWAGWNHLQQAQALAALYQKRKSEEAWGKDRLTPMLAGLLELLPWIKQWHNEPSDEFNGMRLGDFFEGFLDGECRTLGLTREDLRAWRPEARPRRKEAPVPVRKERPAQVFAVRPELEDPFQEGLFVLSALVEVRGGKISHMEAARAFVLLFQPDLLAVRASSAMRGRVKAWLLRAKSRSLPASLFTTIEKDLLTAGHLRREVDAGASSLSLLKGEAWWTSPLDAWYLAEAKLALDVVAALLDQEWTSLASSLAVEDRAAVAGAA